MVTRSGVRSFFERKPLIFLIELRIQFTYGKLLSAKFPLHSAVHFSTAVSARRPTHASVANLSSPLLPPPHAQPTCTHGRALSSPSAHIPRVVPSTLNWIPTRSSNLAAKLCFTAGQFHPRLGLPPFDSAHTPRTHG
jgi:hypothetical protein